MLSSRKFFLLLFFFLLIISGFFIYRIYFLQKPEVTTSFSLEDTSPAVANVPEHQNIPVSPPDYQGSVAEGSEQESSTSDSTPSSTNKEPPKEAGETSKVPSAPSEFIIVHSGSITEIKPDFLTFEEPHPDGKKELKAQITEDTEIRLVTVPRTMESNDEKELFQVTQIKVSELKIGDQILVLGIVKSADQAAFRAIRVDKNDYR